MLTESDESTTDHEYGVRLTSLVEVITELSDSESVDALCRLGVEFGRDRLSFDRLGIWFYDREEACFRGSYGTDSAGRIRDERDCSLPLDPNGNVSGNVPPKIGEYLKIALEKAKRDKPAVLVDNEVHSWRTGEKLGNVNSVFAAMRSQKGIIGFLGVDNLLTGRPFTEIEIHLITLYASSLGHLFSRQRLVEQLRRSGAEQEKLVAEKTRDLARTVRDLQAEVSERKRTEAALRDSEERFFSIWRESADGMRLIDERGGIVAVNPAFCRMVELREDELLGNPLTVIFSPDNGSKEALHDYLDRFRDGEMEAHYERTIRLWNGKVRHFDLSSSLIETRTSEGKALCLTIFRDITERKQAEQERRDLERRMLDTQKLEGLSILAGGIAHDFNNILTGILGNANLGITQLGENSPVRTYFENIENASMEAAALCKKMLAYAGQQNLERHEVDLNQVLKQMHHLLRISIASTIALKLELGDGLPLVNAEPSQLEQMIMNLAINAAEAIGEKAGEIRIKSGVKRVGTAAIRKFAFPSELAPGNAVYLEVSDNGGGMSPDARQRAFDPFFTTKFTGRGLGLAAVQGIVNTYKGGCEILTEQGKGTTLRILLPPVSGKLETAAASEPLVSEGRDGGGFVLVVDDEPGIRQVAKEMLETIGFSVLTASDGTECVEVYRARHSEIDAVILDMTMPEMGGVEALAEIRRIRPESVVLLMSGYSESAASSRFDGQKPDGFIEKPFSLEGLERSLRRVIPAAAC